VDVEVERTAEALDQAAERMAFLATHDALTGLANRTLLMETLGTELARCRRRQSRCAVLFMDMDRFKEVNDQHGHETGDRLLKMFSERLTKLFREADLVVRLGGDEFAILLCDVDIPKDIARLVRRMQRTLAAPFEIDDLNLHAGVSIGAAIFPDHAQQSDMLMRHADVAMYTAKRHGVGFQMYRSDLKQIASIPSASISDEFETSAAPNVEPPCERQPQA
jgi:diguanylate cyclase (GGDEF)-like protein